MQPAGSSISDHNNPCRKLFTVGGFELIFSRIQRYDFFSGSEFHSSLAGMTQPESIIRLSVYQMKWVFQLPLNNDFSPVLYAVVVAMLQYNLVGHQVFYGGLKYIFEQFDCLAR